jgi:tetratricopeptide (TPR) repeat protein
VEPRAAGSAIPQIPGYEVLGLLGRGGMGLVFRARHVALNRLVALKVMRGGAGAEPQHRARFHIEAEAVASLQHPNIVQIHDVGEHDGCPYFAMELVEGGTLAERLAEGLPTPDEAARLTEVLARAMHRAHQRGIVHRDLKPANVLLQTADLKSQISDLQSAVPKITDFGLAKRFEDDGPAPTRTGAILGTPAYMAPEQAWGRPQDIAPPVDVYALGAILYEMLAGRPPFRGASDVETLYLLRAAEPARPSGLRPGIARDLETICLKCLHKEPARRYATAEELADDLRRYREGEPVRARPVGRGERLLKWARRRPAVAALAGCLLLAAGAVVAGVMAHEMQLRAERDRAEKNLRVAVAAVEKMLTEVAEKDLHSEPRSEIKRRRLLEKALAFYEELLSDRGDDPALRRETALARLRVADIRRWLDDRAGAEEAYGQAIAQFTQLDKESPSEPEHRQHLAYAHNYRGEVFRAASRWEEALADYNAALALQEPLAQAPGRPDHLLDLARTRYNLGLLLAERNDPAAAERQFDEAIALLTPLAGADAAAEPRQHLARAHLDRATVRRRLARVTDGRADCDRAVALLQGLADADPPNPEYRVELAIALANRGNTFDPRRQRDEAERDYGAALRLLRELKSDFPRVPGFRVELANTCNSLAAFRARTESPGEAKKCWDEAHDLWRGLIAGSPERASYHGDLGMTLGNLGWLHLQQRHPQDAVPCLEEALAELKVALAPNPAEPSFRRAQRRAGCDLAAALVRQGRHEAAARRAAALAADEPRARGCYLAACFLARCVAEVDGAADLAPADRQRLSDDYAERARSLLRQAAAEGLPGLRDLADEAGFEPLRARDDFRRLIADAPPGR